MNVMTLMAVALAGWMNRQQQDVIEYLREEVRVLKELQGKRRLRFSDDQRRASCERHTVAPVKKRSRLRVSRVQRWVSRRIRVEGCMTRRNSLR